MASRIAAVSKYIVAFFGLFLVVTTWVSMAEVVVSIPNPYFVAYFVHSFYSVGYIIWILWKVCPGGYKCNQAQDGKLTWKRALWTSAILNVVSLIAGLTWYLSLERTSVAVNTAIYMSLPAFIFVLSVPILREKPTAVKIVSVLLQVGGVAIVAIGKDPCHSPPGNSTQHSNVSLLLGAAQDKTAHCGAPGTPLGYTILYKRLASFKDDPASIPNSFRMLGLMGIHSLLYCWPLVVIVHFSGIMPFQWPTLVEFQYLLLTAAFDFILNISVILVISLTSPLFAGVGQVLVLPVGVVADYLIHHTTLVWYGFIGVGLIALGFVGFNISHFWEVKMERKIYSKLHRVDSSLSSSSSTQVVLSDDEGEVRPLLNLQQQKKRKRNWKQIVFKFLI